MTKQRRSFFVDDILHMVMPRKENIQHANENGDWKRKRSISSDDGTKTEEKIFKKKYRTQDPTHDDEDDRHGESDYSQVVDIIGDGDDESCISDNSNNIDSHSGK